MPAVPLPVSSEAPLRSPFVTILMAWLMPGSGHYFLGRRVRGAIIFATVILCFTIGLLMHGPMFQLGSSGDLLSRLIQYGGFVGNVAAGIPYFLAIWFGYAQPDQAGHTFDYGSKFLVCAGLLNILAIVDAYEIAARQKD